MSRPRARRGALSMLGDVAAMVVLIVSAVVFFALFLLLKQQVSYPDSELKFSEQQRTAFGGVTLQTYLALPLDLPAAELERYVRRNESGELLRPPQIANVPAYAGTVRDAIPLVFADTACMRWLEQSGSQRFTGRYGSHPAVAGSPAIDYTVSSIFQQPPPTPLCQAFVYRTYLFYRSVALDDLFYVVARQGGNTLRFGSQDAINLVGRRGAVPLAYSAFAAVSAYPSSISIPEASRYAVATGERALPTESPITVFIVYLERDAEAS